MTKKQKAIANPFSSKKLKIVRNNMMLWLESISNKIPAMAYDNYANKINNAQLKTIKDLYDNVSVLIAFGKRPTLKQVKEQKEIKKAEAKLNEEHIQQLFALNADEGAQKSRIMFSGKDVTVKSSHFKNSAEARVISIKKQAVLIPTKQDNDPNNKSIRIKEPQDEMIEGPFNETELTNHNSVFSFFKKMTSIVVQNMKELYKKFGKYKITFALQVRMYSNAAESEKDIIFRSGVIYETDENKNGSVVMNTKNLQNIYDHGMQIVLERIETMQEHGSDWSLVKINKLYLDIAKYTPFAGASYIELPQFIQAKKCCVNILNNDNRCHEYSILCALYGETMRKNGNTNLNRVAPYAPYMGKLDYTDIKFPVSIEDMKKFETQNKLPINVYGVNEDEEITLLHAHTYKASAKVINLLYIEDDEKEHYCYIKNFNRLFKRHKLPCEKCHQIFSTDQAMKNHIAKNKCIEFSGTAFKNLPVDGKHKVKFSAFHKQLKVPFVLYADIESILTPVVVDDTDEKTQIYQNHKANHVGVKLVSQFPELLADSYKQFDGENCIVDFINYCLDKEYECKAILNDQSFLNFNWSSLTKEALKQFNSSFECHICKKKIENKAEKALDHCHITGAYRGPAHRACNVNYNYKNFKLPVIFHNLKGYDSHFIIQNAGIVAKTRKFETKIIPTTMEKYLSFSLGNCVFLDSLQFINSSLESLVEALNKVYAKSNDIRVFKHFNEDFPNISLNLNNLLRQKGVFPYDWFNSEEKLKSTSLPADECFYNTLNECETDVEDIKRAREVFCLSGCATFYDYLSLYLKTDVLLLTDVFEAFRSMCMTYYGLDPCHYYTSPGFSWDSMLKMTDIEIDCFKQGEDEMLEMTQQGMRGGISMISTRYAKANNTYMKEYDVKIESSHIMYGDANNLYGWAMSQYLPTGDYKLEEISAYTLKRIMAMRVDEERGCILEVDLDVPEEKHNFFNDYPLAPESRKGEYSPLMNKIMSTYNIKQSAEVEKLIPNLYNKTKYVLHYRNLQLYLSLGLKLMKIHRVISFKQSDYLKKYIDFNTKKRAESTNDFEKDLFKLFNNSIFGKTCENVEKRIDCSLICDEKKFLKSVAKPHFKNFKIFSEGMVAVEMNKTEVIYNRPMIVGMCILDLSKVLMYDFHYNTMMKKYGERCKLLFTDTDSLCYHIKTEDIYEDMKENKDAWDFSDYPKSHFLHSDANKKVIGMMKDVENAKPITEFCALRAKMYGYQTEDKNKSVAKGIKRSQIKKLKLEQYKQALFGNTKEEIQQVVSANFIRQNNHVVNSVRITKVGLSGIDNKKYVCNNNIDTLALGHWKIKSEEY